MTVGMYVSCYYIFSPFDLNLLANVISDLLLDAVEISNGIYESF